MIFQNIYLQIVILIFAAITYSFLIFELGDAFLRNSRLKKQFRIPLGIFNALLLCAFSILPSSTAATFYLCFFIIILIEFFIFYNDKLIRSLMIVVSYTFNLMAVRAVCVSACSLITNMPILEVVQNDILAAATMSITFVILNTLLLIVKILIPTERSKAITEHIAQMLFLTSWAVVASLYFIFQNSKIYNTVTPIAYTVQNELWLSITFLIGFYIMLVFSIMVGESVNIKNTNKELTETIDTQKQFRESVINDALTYYEVNLTKDLLLIGFEDIKDKIDHYHNKYSVLLKILTSENVFADDVLMFTNYADPKNLLNEYNNGIKEMELIYRRIDGSGHYIWAKAVANLYEDGASGDIKAFVYIKDYNDEKMKEIELKNRAERDSLTSIYNKGTTESLITDFLSSNLNYPHKGSLFIIDVDNFKMVNDCFGHSFGDEVLRDLSCRLKNIFRNSTDIWDFSNHEDIIGRVGGDEFIIFIKNTSDKELLANKAESICEAFRNEFRDTEGNIIEISCSIGIAVCPNNGTTFNELYMSADIALYLSKGKGKNVYTFYNGENFEGYVSQRGEIDSPESN